MFRLFTQFILWKKNPLAEHFWDKNCVSCLFHWNLDYKNPPPHLLTHQHSIKTNRYFTRHPWATRAPYIGYLVLQSTATRNGKGHHDLQRFCLGKMPKNTKLSSPIGHWRGFRQWIRVYHWYSLMITDGRVPLLVYEGFVRFFSKSKTPLLTVLIIH